MRNAEYRRSKLKIATSINIQQKDNLNIFLIHPWPMYMTSWSLALLFFHLWISAFICLYFYAINQKSCLTQFFSFVFGPFSCSKRSPNKTFTSWFKPTQTSEINTPDVPEQNGLTVLALDKQSDDLTQVTFKSDSDNEIKSFKETYCDNQEDCNMPSISVISDAHAWKLWIDTHVPSFILILIKISWLLNNIVTISAIVVSFVYLCYVYFANFPQEPSWASELGNWHRHGINSIGNLL